MSDLAPKYAFAIGVVGEELQGAVADRLASWLDVVVNRYRSSHNLTLLTFGKSPGSEWAKSQHLFVCLIPRLSPTGNAFVKSEMEMVSQADAIVIVGNPQPWKRLIRYAHEADVPVRYFKP